MKLVYDYKWGLRKIEEGATSMGTFIQGETVPSYYQDRLNGQQAAVKYKIPDTDIELTIDLGLMYTMYIPNPNPIMYSD